MKKITEFFEERILNQDFSPARVWPDEGQTWLPSTAPIPTEDQVIFCHDEAGEIWLQVEEEDVLSVEEAIYLHRNSRVPMEFVGYREREGFSFWGPAPICRVAYQYTSYFQSLS